MGVTRTGIHYPKPEFAKWRDLTIIQIQSQCPRVLISASDLEWSFFYTPGDNRRRDVPAILDAIFHCLERAGVVFDDKHIANLYFKTLPVDKENAGMVIEWK